MAFLNLKPQEMGYREVIKLKKLVAIALCFTTFALTTAYAIEPCMMCSDEVQEQMEVMGYEAKLTPDGIVVTNTVTGEEQIIIVPEGSSQYCAALSFCIFFTFFIAYGIFFLPCYVAWAANCT